MIVRTVMADMIAEGKTTEITPLIRQDVVTFVWKGKTAPGLMGDITGWEEGKSIRLKKLAKGVWIYRAKFPSDAYIEYSFVSDGENLVDPSNPRQTSNGVGGYNSYFCMPNYEPTRLAKYDRRIPHGTLSHFSLPTNYYLLGDQRAVHFYQPPADEPVPLVVVWDGQEYLRRVRLVHIVDNLIAQRRIRPIALAFVYNGGEKARSIEYSPSEATLTWLMSTVLPLAKKELNLIKIKDQPGAFGVLGASMGGLMALYTAARFPQVFGNVLSQSGAFSSGGVDAMLYKLLESSEKHPLRIWLDVGLYDLSGILEANRKMNHVLTQRGYPVFYREYPAGHNYPSWKDEIWRGLETLYSVNK